MTNDAHLDAAEPRRWSAPAYSLAELLTGQRSDEEAALKWLGRTFATSAERLFAPDPEHPTLLDLLTSHRFKPRRYEGVADVMKAAIADWGPRDRNQSAALRQMVGEIRAVARPERMALVVSLLLPPGAGLMDAPGARRTAGTAAGGRLHYFDYADERIGGKFLVDSVSFLDPRQNVRSDCYLIAALSALCWVDPDRVAQRLKDSVRVSDRAPKRFHAWTPFDLDSASRATEIKADCELPYSPDRVPLFARSATNEKESWPAMMEKIYMLAITAKSDELASGKGPALEQYKKLDFGWPHEACRRLLGGRIGEQRDNLARTLRQGHESTNTQLLDHSSGKTLVPTAAWTLNPASEREGEAARYKALRGKYVANRIIANHAYTVLGRMKGRRTNFVVLREPQCLRSNRPLPESHAKAEKWVLRDGARTLAEVPLNVDGVFALREETFDELFAGIGWMVPPAA